MKRILRALWLDAGTVLLVAIVVVALVVICLGTIGSGGTYGMP